MNRSRRKNPRTGNTKADSEKKNKQHSNRAYRRRVKSQLQGGKWFEWFPKRKELHTTWTFDKDGKQWFDEDAFPELMRK
jgi:predicted DCC family thiol-disulfide oxidoreductase YuxK